jgi:transketolase
VKIFGLDPGITATNNGGTHMSFEDVGIIRSMPKTTIFEPCDEVQLKKSLSQIVDYESMIYVRIFRKGNIKIFDENNCEFDLMKASIIKSGSDISIFCTGIMVEEALKAYEILKSKNISAEIIDVHTIKPLDSNTILDSIKKTKKAIVAENHNKFGGLFSAICELAAENFPVPVKYVAIEDEFGQVGNLDFLKKYYKLTCENIVEKALSLVN